jgi:hypothetical protein
MTTPESSRLHPKEEILLNRYFDGDCSFISRYFAEQLLKRNPHAREFYNRLQDVSSHCAHYASTREPTTECDLWANIERRIITEERLGRYETEIAQEPSLSFLKTFLCQQTLVGAVSGASVAVILLTFMPSTSRDTASHSAPLSGVEFARMRVQNDRNSKPRSAIVPNIIPEREDSGLHELVSWNSASGAEATDLQPKRIGSAQVDWMKANGPLALLENPSDSSSIIWVKRRRGSLPPSLRGTVPVQPTAYSQPGGETLLPLFNE